MNRIKGNFDNKMLNAPFHKFQSFKTQLCNSLMLLFCVTCITTTMSVAGVSEARADFRICNDTKSLVGAALGYKENEKWLSEGWFQVPAETCSSLIEGDLNSRFYYIYAEDADKGGQWRGDVFLCTNEREFKIEGVEDCFARGHIKTGFFEIDTGNRANWMVRLTEQSQSQPQQPQQ
jgi:uncharacterized membrane protein